MVGAPAFRPVIKRYLETWLQPRDCSRLATLKVVIPNPAARRWQTAVRNLLFLRLALRAQTAGAVLHTASNHHESYSPGLRTRVRPPFE